MSNALLPALPGLTWNNTKKPKFATKVQTAIGGVEVAAAFQPYPSRGYALSYEVLRQYGAFTEFATLYGFYCARLGAFDTFLYNDPEDNTATTAPFGTGDGSTTAFQLARTLGGFSEPVYNLNATPTPSIFDNGVLKTVTTDYTISASGLVTFAVAPINTHALTWTGAYYWRCRFDADDLEFSEDMNLFWACKQLSFRTVLGA